MPQSRQEKQNQIGKLLEERAKRSPEQQLAKLDAGGFTAVKERARLKAQIASRNKK
jgi:hypothetical protein